MFEYLPTWHEHVDPVGVYRFLQLVQTLLEVQTEHCRGHYVHVKSDVYKKLPAGQSQVVLVNTYPFLQAKQLFLPESVHF